jgi:hypothetical protein
MSEYNFIDFFPDCSIPACRDKPVHQHIWDKQQEILDSTTKYLYCQGGVGSAKSVAFAAKSVYLSVSIPDNEGFVCRKNFKDLYKSSWKDIKQVIARLVKKNIIPQPIFSSKTQGDYTQIIFPHNNSTMYAIQGKNWSDALGSSYGWFWVDDAMESYEELFIGDDTSAGLLARLRLPHIHYYKETWHETERPHGSLHGMVSSNPPPVGHYLHKLFGTKPGFYSIGEDSVQWIMTATYDNLAVGADYAKGIMAIQAKMGRSANVARRVIFGESLPAYGGVKVFPEFDHARHVAPLKYDPKLPLIRAWDFGYHHPAVVFSNLLHCAMGKNHYQSLSECGESFGINIWDFYKVVKEHTYALYSDHSLILDGGDRAGYRRSDSNKDRRGPIPILQQDFKEDALRFRFRWLDLENSLEYMRSLLKEKCACGREIIQVSPDCPILIGALEGGYKYPKTREGNIGAKPTEDRYFADVACGWRYGAENFVKHGVPWEERDSLRPSSDRLPRHRTDAPWSWMEATPEQMAALLVQHH